MPRRPTDRGRAAAVLLCVILAGCSTYHAVQLSTSGGEEGAGGTILPGTEVRATTVTGRRVEGEMIAVRGDSLYIGQPGNYGYRRYVLGLDLGGMN